ncbi:histidinol-phosphate transaminase [Haloglomus salinum]|uniref:histidinol-phosphate transaminase n=1 Tax=Haloglomus salinum TaxID=2962673 RepID=UPI0020C9EE17|nr:histidinol-phosphate transaminase [Haloglomus salinum]
MQPRDLSALTPYEAGRGIEEVAREVGIDPDDLVKLSSNENPHGPSPAAVETMREHADGVHHYPKAAHADLQDALAERWDLAPEQVWLANGGDGALDYLARAMLEPDDSVLVPDPGFAYYAMSVRYHHGRVNTYPLYKEEDFEQRPENVLDAYDGERVVYLISPHSPTGREIPREAILEVADGVADDTVVLVDEAYGAFSEAPSKVDLVRERDDVAVLRTFSKSHGLAGVRLGYLLAPESWGDAYARINTPFAVNELALRAGLAALEDDDHVETTVESATWAREFVHDNLAAKTWPSQGNFVLAEVGDAEAVFEAAKGRGVIVRDASSFGLPGCIRITCGTKAETTRAVEVLNEVLAMQDPHGATGGAPPDAAGGGFGMDGPRPPTDGPDDVGDE